MLNVTEVYHWKESLNFAFTWQYSTNLSNKVECLIECVGAGILMRDEQVCPAAGSTVSVHCTCKTSNNDNLSLFKVWRKVNSECVPSPVYKYLGLWDSKMEWEFSFPS